MPDISLSQIHIYPLKSAAGISLPSAAISARGFLHDRRWMLVDQNDCFITQRKFPRMALISTALAGATLHIRLPAQSDLKIPLAGCSGRELSVKIWSDTCLAYSCGPEADDRLSRFLETEVHLVYMPDRSNRMTDPAYGERQSPVSLADAFPFLLISEASLDDLNHRIKPPLEMRRFRPNLVIKGCEPYEEDRWKIIRIGEVSFEVAKPCSRCSITTVDPDTAQTGKEPLRTLAKYRKRNGKVYFGQNLIHQNSGKLHTGMPLQIVSRRESV